MLKSIYISFHVEFCILLGTSCNFSPMLEPMFSFLVFRVVVYLCFQFSFFFRFSFIFVFGNVSSHYLGYAPLHICFPEECALHSLLRVSL
jgi:hypothetical protein